ncbi:MAG: hypothetical protein FWD45_04525 [Coriobacteriia bacterium]|nr:hypothetical protein [Coriobacteriia bacterium]
MQIRKWNYATRAYDIVELPDDWRVSFFETDMDTLVNCPHCGKSLSFGEAYTSRQFHSKAGFGYGVFTDCYKKEWDLERIYIEVASIEAEDTE